MSEPLITVDQELSTARYPAYFQTSSKQIGAVMEEIAGLSSDVIAATSLEFASGGEDDHFLFRRTSPNEFILSMSGIRRALETGNLNLPESWRAVYPENDLIASTHLAVASVIACLKAEKEVQSPSPNKVALSITGPAIALGALCGINAEFVTRGNLPFTATATGLGLGVGLLMGIKQSVNEWQKRYKPLVTNFIVDKTLAESLKGAVDFDLRN